MGYRVIEITFTPPEKRKALPFIFRGKNMVAKATINSNPPLQLDMKYVNNEILFKSASDFTIVTEDNKSYLVINEYKLRDFYYTKNTTITFNVIKG